MSDAFEKLSVIKKYSSHSFGTLAERTSMNIIAFWMNILLTVISFAYIQRHLNLTLITSRIHQIAFTEKVKACLNI